MKTESTIYWTVICVLWYYHWRGDRCRDSFSDLSGRDCFAADFDGIAAYIAKNEICPKCGSHMMLSKTKSGNANLTCSHCGNTEFLTPASVNYYIQTYGAVCPKCCQRIYCGLSYKGLYIKYPENHRPKIEEL